MIIDNLISIKYIYDNVSISTPFCIDEVIDLLNNLKILSITLIYVDVVSNPQNAAQSFTHKPAPITSLPRLTVPAINGICNKFDN